MSVDVPRLRKKSPDDEISHYALANKMINYQSHDVGTHFLCVGANWIHDLKPKAEVGDEDKLSEGRQIRLFSWLILCDDRKMNKLLLKPGADYLQTLSYPYMKTLVNSMTKRTSQRSVRTL